jgi:two-component system sensor histidine kinase TctE
MRSAHDWSAIVGQASLSKPSAFSGRLLRRSLIRRTASEATAIQQRFIANAAHQLRTPLAGLQMHLEIMLRQALTDEVRSEIERLHGSTVRAGRLATQLLALARAEPGPVHHRALELLDLRSVAGEAARDWAPRAIANDRDLGFSLDLPE